jgi:hypothetical protein
MGNLYFRRGKKKKSYFKISTNQIFKRRDGNGKKGKS